MQSDELNIWKKAYSTDALFSKVLKASIMDNDEEGNHPQHQIHDRLVYLKDWNVNFRLCVPDSLQISIKAKIHNTLTESAHGGQLLEYSRGLKYFQGGSSKDIQCSVEFLEPHQVKVVSFKHLLLKEISLKLSEPWISEWFMALHSSNSLASL